MLTRNLSAFLAAGAVVSGLADVELKPVQARSNPRAVAAEQLQARLRRYALANKPLSGPYLEKFLAGKAIGANQNLNPDIPSFLFYAPGRVIVGSGQGLMQEYVLYEVRKDRFCVPDTKQKYDCFQIFLQKHGPPILKMGDGPKARYALASVHK